MTDEEFGVEMIVINSISERPGIGIEIDGHCGYLGQSLPASMFTAEIGDWIFASRQGA